MDDLGKIVREVKLAREPEALLAALKIPPTASSELDWKPDVVITPASCEGTDTTSSPSHRRQIRYAAAVSVAYAYIIPHYAAIFFAGSRFVSRAGGLP